MAFFLFKNIIQKVSNKYDYSNTHKPIGSHNGVKDACGVTAKQILIDKIGNNNVECISEGEDQYKRTLAECFVNNESLSSYLVRSGYAFAYRRYSKKFVPDEDYARINKIGMWSMEFDYPWDYRKSKKN